MDHDSVVIPGPQDRDFYSREALPEMRLDETYLWGRPGSTLGTVGHLRSIYRIGDDLNQQGRVLARTSMKKAYKKTQHALSSNPNLQRLFDQTFVERILDFDRLVKGYLRINPNSEASSKWKGKQREILTAKAYEDHEIDAHMEALENNKAFLETHSFLF
jgi:hypothetical protein